jgi:hypothetical protein
MPCSTYLYNLYSLGLHNRIYINVTIRLSALYHGGFLYSFLKCSFYFFHFFPYFLHVGTLYFPSPTALYFVPKAGYHCPWPSSQFNKWQAQNKLLSSSLIVIGSSPRFTPPSHQGLFSLNFYTSDAIFREKEAYLNIFFVVYKLLGRQLKKKN